MTCSHTMKSYASSGCSKRLYIQNSIKRIPRKRKKKYTKEYREICKKSGFTYVSFGKLTFDSETFNKK